MSTIEGIECGILVAGVLLIGYCVFRLICTKDGYVRKALIWIFASYLLVVLNMLMHLLCRVHSVGYLALIRHAAYVIQGAVLIPLAWLAHLLKYGERSTRKGRCNGLH